MKKIILSFALSLAAITTSAQSGQITNIKILGIDKYPTESFLNLSVTVKYARIKDEGGIIVYMDDDPQSKPASAGQAWSMLPKRNHTGTILPATTAEKTSTFTFKMILHPERLKDNVAKYYLRGFVTEKNFSERTDNLLSVTEPIAFNLNTVKVTTHKQNQETKQPTAEERKRQEQIVQQSNQEVTNVLGGLLGGMISVASNDKCMYCGGEGCASCNYSGYSNVGEKAFAEGIKMVSGKNNSSTSPSSKVLNGYHVKEYSDGTYKGNFKNGKMHGQGTLLFKNGNKYVGNFVNGHMNGKGTLTFANGEKYVGDFKDDMMHGKGKFSMPDGGSYEGDFQNDNVEGVGTYYLPNEGLKYVGEVKNNAMDGEGTLYFIKEKQYIKGVFKNGELVQTIKQGTYSESKKVSNARKPVQQKSRK